MSAQPEPAGDRRKEKRSDLPVFAIGQQLGGL